MLQVNSENKCIAETRWFSCFQNTSCLSEPERVPANADMKYGISTCDALASREGVPCAEKSVAETGYAGADAMAVGTNAYNVESILEPSAQDNDNQTYWVAKLGLSSICNALVSRINEYKTRACIKVNNRVSHLELASNPVQNTRFQRISVIRNGQHAFSQEHFKCHAVVIAIPPEQAKEIEGIQPLISPVFELLKGVSLFKAFCAFDASLQLALGFQSCCFHAKSNNLCQQIISNTYPGHAIIQIAYCSGQRADSLEHFRLCGKARRAISNGVARIPHDKP